MAPRADLIADGSVVPDPVIGGLTFAKISAAESDRCAVPPGGQAYCECSTRTTAWPSAIPGSWLHRRVHAASAPFDTGAHPRRARRSRRNVAPVPYAEP
jgi:hypothetical protein